MPSSMPDSKCLTTHFPDKKLEWIQGKFSHTYQDAFIDDLYKQVKHNKTK